MLQHSIGLLTINDLGIHALDDLIVVLQYAESGVLFVESIDLKALLG
jgi:hypothetical protein